jgi:hypothetical protein
MSNNFIYFLNEFLYTNFMSKYKMVKYATIDTRVITLNILQYAQL